jgi:hypothetical protein
MFKTRRHIGVGLAAVAACAALAGSASAATTSGSQIVTGTTLGSLALGVPATPAVLDNGFTPGSTATNTAPAALLVTATGNWTLTVDDAANNGHLVAAAAGCSGSEASTAHQLKVQTAGGTSASNSASPVTIAAPVSGVGATAATGNLANALTASYSLLIDPVEQMLAGCVYSTTVNWTVQ